MNRILTDILSSPWLINDERKDAYASLLLALINGENINDADTSIAREKNRSYVIASSSNPERVPFGEQDIPEGSIAIIPIRSEIMKYDQMCGPRGSMTLAGEIQSADNNPNIKSILLVIDSPGGQVSYTDILADVIKNSNTPVVAYVEGMAASGAYWLASSCAKIIASSDLDQVGCIGTMMSFADLKPAYEKMGVKFHEIYATDSKDKNKDFRDLLDGKYDKFRKETLDIINKKFLDSVRSNRQTVDETALTGKMYFAPDAIELGLIDEIGSFEYALEQADSIQPNDTFLKNDTMKISMKAAWSAIASIFSMKTEEIEGKELTEEMIGQLNDKLTDQSTKITELETSFQDERAAKLQLEEDLAAAQSALAASESALAETTRQFEALRNEDAEDETMAGKKKDKIESGAEEVVFAHNEVADKFLGIK